MNFFKTGRFVYLKRKKKIQTPSGQSADSTQRSSFRPARARVDEGACVRRYMIQ